MSNRQEKPPLKCLLGIDPEKTQKCKPSECASCGWEAAEAARRREYVKEHSLTLCADGFRRLIIKKENDMAIPYKECPHCGSRPYDPENPNARCSAQSKKPEGIAAELADVIIRVLDYCAYAGIDIENVLEVKHEYNKSRPYRHGGKKC
jgi:hypothetical protein